MKTLKTVCLLIFLSATLTATAQKQKYSFVVYLSNGTASSSCLDIKKAYVSPIVSHNFEFIPNRNYIHPTDLTNKKSDLTRKWNKKCQAQFNIDNTYCWGNNKKIWYDSRSELDEERYEEIAYLKRKGYTVYDSFSFGFYFE